MGVPISHLKCISDTKSTDYGLARLIDMLFVGLIVNHLTL